MSINKGAWKLLVLGVLASGCADAAEGAPGADEWEDEEVEHEQAVAPVRDAGTKRRPVVLVAGLLQNAKTVAPMGDALRAAGFDVTLFVPPGMGLGDINVYAKSLGKVVDGVLERTGAEEVDLVGHSQGGVTARRYVQLTGPDAPVHTLVSMGSPQQGTNVGGLANLLVASGVFEWAQGLTQLLAGSTLLTEMNEQSDPTPGDVRYLAIGTRKDQITNPVARSAIPGAEHLIMQEVCPGRSTGHFGLLSDAWVQQVVISTLSDGPAKGDCRARPVGGKN